MKVLVLYYSMYGHVREMAEAVAEGARQVKGAEVMVRRVPETLSEAVSEDTGESALPEEKAEEESSSKDS